ncbi:MAG: Brp/Blh family beta-carotene 15,15'-dioxygenase [Balneolaceae bacterium]|nr:Brp/Blh family beta-carotene 15,15'-dioxygenase [Balneolaceae bacterium]
MKHHLRSLNIVGLIVTIFVIGISFISSAALETLAPWLLFLSVVVLGIPHGAIDHIIAARIYGLKESLTGHLIFYSSYLLVMILVGLLWLFFPLIGMIFFLIISIYHFGQADMISLMKPNSAAALFFAWIRGILIIGLIIFTHPEISLSVIESAIRMQPDWFIILNDFADVVYPSIILLYIASAGWVLSQVKIKIGKPLFLAESLLLIALLLFTNPLVSFADYFALWHSAGHVLEMIGFFKAQGEEITIGRFYVLAMPFTLVSILGLAMLFLIHQAYEFGDEMVSLLFILISVLTLPHMIVVDRMFKKK